MAAINTPFFGSFPKLKYDINNVKALTSGPHETVTDIFFRIGVIKNTLNNISSYYVYELEENDTPEILAEKIYNDAGAGWIILYANDMFDPLFDWPLNYDAFKKMIIDRYGSVETAQTTPHHYEKIISRYNSFYDITTESRFVIDYDILTTNTPDVPYSYYTDFLNSVDTYSVDGKTVVETTSHVAISIYDHELKLNDDKRLIKVIKAEYYNQIMQEFRSLVKLPNMYIRTLV